MVFKCFSCVFASISDAYFKHFICLQTYVISVASGCFKLDWVLQLSSRFMLPRLGDRSCSRPRLASATFSLSFRCCWSSGQGVLHVNAFDEMPSLISHVQFNQTQITKCSLSLCIQPNKDTNNAIQ
jgi:hypothetical protein